MMTMTLLAAGFENIDAEWLRNMAIFIAAVLGSGLAGKKLFFDKSPLPIQLTEDQLKAQQKSLEDLRLELKDLAPSEQVDALIRKLQDAATRDDLDKVKDSLKGYVDQAQLDRRLGEMKDLIARVEEGLAHQIADQTKQITDLRAYLHNDVHEFRKAAQAQWSIAENQREGMQSRMNVFAETLFEIRGWIRAQRGEPTP